MQQTPLPLTNTRLVKGGPDALGPGPPAPCLKATGRGPRGGPSGSWGKRCHNLALSESLEPAKGEFWGSPTTHAQLRAPHKPRGELLLSLLRARNDFDLHAITDPRSFSIPTSRFLPSVLCAQAPHGASAQRDFPLGLWFVPRCGLLEAGIGALH